MRSTSADLYQIRPHNSRRSQRHADTRTIPRKSYNALIIELLKDDEPAPISATLRLPGGNTVNDIVASIGALPL